MSSVLLADRTLDEEAPLLHRGTALAPGVTVIEHLARGASLDVYEVWSTDKDCGCVAKTLRPDRLDDDSARGRLLAEGDLLLSLAHPGLVRGYELHAGPTPVIVMETRTGQTLGHLIERRTRPMAAGDLIELGAQLVSVLGYLHRRDILHLDLKPSNIVADAGRAVVLDLSHARPPGRCGPGFGTAEYMSPEQLVGGEVSAASDVYGLAGVLYRAATRRRPFPTDGSPRPADAIPPFGVLSRRALPRTLVDLITAGLDPDPSGRPSLAQAGMALAAT